MANYSIAGCTCALSDAINFWIIQRCNAWPLYHLDALIITKTSRRCYDKAALTCQKCETARLAQEKRRQRDHQFDEERQAKQRAYLTGLIEIEDEIEHQKRLLASRTEEEGS